MTKLTEQKAGKIIRDNFEYLDEVVETAIVNLLEDEGVDEGENDFAAELQYIYDVYVGEEKYGGKIV